jgi:hypothetical protein
MSTQSQPKNNSKYYRNGFKWNSPEINCLHSEFENKKYSIDKIAFLHKRSIKAILYKLLSEGLDSK